MITQRLVNRFPTWTKTRIDPSSLGYRFFSTFGDYFDFAYAENKKILDDTKLLKHGLGVGYLYQVPLVEEDYFVYTTATGGTTVWEYPTITGTVGVDTYTLTRVDGIEDITYPAPTRLSLEVIYNQNNLMLYSDDGEGTVVSNAIEKPEKLIVSLTNSTNFFQRTRQRNVRVSGQHIVIIKGKDINGSSFVEHVQVPDVGYFWTKNIVKEITEVIREGFDGTITISMPGAQDFIVNPWRTCVTQETEGQMKLSLSSQVSGLDTHTKVYYYTDLVKQGADYRDGSPEISTNEVEAWEQYLLDSAGEPVTPVDIAISPNNLYAYLLGSDSRVHVYDLKPNSFTAPVSEDDRFMATKTSYIDLLPLRPWALIDEEMRLFTRYTRMRFPVRNVIIRRVSPAGVEEFLQADKTWSASEYGFLGKGVTEGLPEDSWVDFSFTSLFDEFGQWEFWTEVTTDFDVTVSYTGVLVDALEATASITTGLLLPVGIYFAHDDKLIVISDTDAGTGEEYTLNGYAEHADLYLADERGNHVYLREQYDSVEVT